MFYTKNLRDNEDIVLLAKKHWLAYLINYLICFVLYFIPFFFLFILFNWGLAGRIIWFVLVVAASIYFLRLLGMLYFNCLLITSQRIVNYGYYKIFTKKVIEFDL